jgi:RHS repeat-associated protein
MFLDQTDVVVPGVAGGIVFTRSYNSDNVDSGRYGLFGPGWFHSYESNIAIQPDGVLKLRQANGMPLYYVWSASTNRYEVRVPATEQSWVLRQSGGRLLRRFRSGAMEGYDSSGHLVSIRDMVGNVTTLTWTDGKLRTIRNPGGRVLRLRYAGDLLTEVAGPDELVKATYGYGGDGLLATVTYLDGTGYRFSYDPSGRLQTVQDLSGEVLESHTYDPATGRAVTSSLADGQEALTLTYQPSKTIVTDALGNATTYEFVERQQIKRVSKIIQPCACAGTGVKAEDWQYDGLGQALRDRDGSIVFHYKYDAATGDLVEMDDGLNHSTLLTRDGLGRVVSVTGPDGSLATTTYVAAGPATITDLVAGSRTRTRAIEYTPQGQPLRVTDANGHVTSFSYNAFGDLVATTDPLGNTTGLQYDEIGRSVVVTDPLGHTTRMEYDGRGRAKRVIAHDGSATEFTYDHAGRRATVKDALGRVTRWVYDKYGRLRAVIDPAGGETRYTYDVMSRLVSLTDPEGHETAFAYDASGRLLQVVKPASGVESYAYDPNGLLLSKTDPRGVVTTFIYDLNGRVSAKNYSDGTPGVVYTYDDAGRMNSASSAVDTLGWQYDLVGRTVQETSQRNGTTVNYSYDDVGNRVGLALDGTSYALEYIYDADSRLTTLRGAGLPSPGIGFTYDAASRRRTLTYPNGVVTSYDYDELNRLTSLGAALGTTPITQFGYTYDAVGNRLTKTLLDPQGSETYTYDALDRLTGAARPASAQAFQYDRVGNRTVLQAGGAVLKASYNERNQLVSRQVGGRVPVAGLLSEPASVTVNGRATMALPGNRFEGSADTAPGDNTIAVDARDASGNATSSRYSMNVSGSSATYAYDVAGNLTSKTEDSHVWTYEWDADNRLARVLNDGNEVARFRYDPINRRVERIGADGTTAFTYDGDDILQHLVGATVNRYVHGPGVDEPVAQTDASGLVVSYFYADDEGSIVATTNTAGTISSTRSYDAYGNPEVGAERPGYAFTGREWDPQTQLYYYRARYYDAKAARFLSEDPLHFSAGVNHYAYAVDNPVRYSDPWGLIHRVTVSGQTITVSASITIYGSNASQRLAELWQRDSSRYWNAKKWHFGDYDVRFVFTFTADPSANWCFTATKADNYINVRHSTGEERILDETWGSFGYGRWLDSMNDQDVAHAMGHILGLGDDYNFFTGRTTPGHENHMMTNDIIRDVHEHEVKDVVRAGGGPSM